MPSITTATISELGWCGGFWRSEVGMEERRDALPEARPDPEGIAGIDRLPGAVGGGDVAPGPAGVHHGEHALQLPPQIAAGTPPTRSRWLHQRRDLRPGGLAQLRGAGHAVDRNRFWRGRTGL